MPNTSVFRKIALTWNKGLFYRSDFAMKILPYEESTRLPTHTHTLPVYHDTQDTSLSLYLSLSMYLPIFYHVLVMSGPSYSCSCPVHVQVYVSIHVYDMNRT